MITDSEEFIKIQWLLALSNIPTTDCFKINALIIKLSKENQELKNQQKKFMLWLEDESKEIYRDGGLRQNIFKQVLQKYKEITGILDGKENI